MSRKTVKLTAVLICIVILCSFYGCECAHEWQDGVCAHCGAVCQHSWKDGACVTCGKICSHSWEEGICSVCGYSCAHVSHDVTTLACSVCGEVCSHVYVDDVCTRCTASCEHWWINGKCNLCQKVCSHLWNDDKVCTVCGLTLTSVVHRLDCYSENGHLYGMLYLPSVYHGKLPTVIISHGFNARATNGMAGVLVKLGYAVYTFDFYGGSINTRSDGTMQDMTILTEKADLLAVLDMISAQSFVDTDQIYLYGESQGGLVTAITAVEVEEKIAGAILIYPGFSIFSSIAQQYTSIDQVQNPAIFDITLSTAYYEALFTFMPDTYDLILDTADKDEYYKRAFAVTEKLYKYVAQFSKKVIIFHGDCDVMVDIEFSKEALKYYTNAKLITVVGGQHGFSVENVNRTAMQIDKFIKNINLE